LANKQYISIIRLFTHCGIAMANDFNLARTKKHLLAEFGIAQNGFIEIDGYTYTRQDVFEELEHPNFRERLQFHKEIWNAPPLLNLLEDNTIDFLTIRDGFRSFWNNSEFDVFISPYFAGPFNYVSRVLLTDLRLPEMGELLTFEDFLQAADREEAFRSLRIFLDESLRILRNTTVENYKIMRPKISHWIEMEWYGFFNNLPHEFYDIKHDLIVHLVNLGVGIQKKYRSDCRRMSDQLVSLQEMPESIRQTIVSNHSAYHGSKSTSFRGYFWVGWLIFIVVRAVGSGGCGDTGNDYQFQKSDFSKYEVDSLVRILQDSTGHTKSDTATLRIFPMNPLR